LTKQHRQEALSRAYIQAIAAACGMSYSVANPDYGIDLTLHDILIRNKRRRESGFRLDVQAKSTTTASVRASSIEYRIEQRTYELLRDTEAPIPRILVVLVLPEDEAAWLDQSEEQLVLRRCAYWHCLTGWEPAANRKTISITIPRENVFSIESLRGIMDRVKQGVPI
jgi:hypothetical protein